MIICLGEPWLLYQFEGYFLFDLVLFKVSNYIGILVYCFCTVNTPQLAFDD